MRRLRLSDVTFYCQRRADDTLKVCFIHFLIELPRACWWLQKHVTKKTENKKKRIKIKTGLAASLLEAAPRAFSSRTTALSLSLLSSLLYTRGDRDEGWASTTNRRGPSVYCCLPESPVYILNTQEGERKNISHAWHALGHRSRDLSQTP